MNSPITNFFASVYEWFGLNPFYGKDLGDQLRGWDADCSGHFSGTEWYTYIGLSMIGVTVLLYVTQYHIIDSSRFSRRHHWWLIALVGILVNLLIAFTIPLNALNNNNYCATGDNALHFNTVDCLGFALTNAIWGLVLFIAITCTPWPRRFSRNCRHTTFWKP